MYLPDWKKFYEIKAIINVINKLICYYPMMRSTIMNTTSWCDWEAAKRDVFILRLAGYTGASVEVWPGTLEKNMRNIFRAIRGFIWEHYTPEQFSNMSLIPALLFCPNTKEEFDKYMKLGTQYGEHAISYDRQNPVHCGNFVLVNKTKINKTDK